MSEIRRSSALAAIGTEATDDVEGAEDVTVADAVAAAAAGCIADMAGLRS